MKNKSAVQLLSELKNGGYEDLYEKVEKAVDNIINGVDPNEEKYKKNVELEERFKGLF